MASQRRGDEMRTRGGMTRRDANAPSKAASSTGNAVRAWTWMEMIVVITKVAKMTISIAALVKRDAIRYDEEKARVMRAAMKASMRITPAVAHRGDDRRVVGCGFGAGSGVARLGAIPWPAHGRGTNAACVVYATLLFG